MHLESRVDLTEKILGHLASAGIPGAEDQNAAHVFAPSFAMKGMDSFTRNR
jgi:hypothetical protein